MDILSSPLMWMGQLEPETLLEQGFAVVLGTALASTCGLRAFLPLFTISLLGALGKVELGESFGWMGSPVAAVAFGVAVLLELAGDKFPVVDHALDAAGLVVKPVAASLATASMITGMDPLLALVVGLVTGGVVAEGVHVAKSKVRLFSTAFTGSLGNPILSVAEDVVAFGAVILAWVVPAMMLFGVLFFVGFVGLRWYERRKVPAA